MLLLGISEELSRKDLKNLVFCCEDIIPEAEIEQIGCGTDLFRALKHQNRLGPNQYDYLRERLTAIGRLDLANKLPNQDVGGVPSSKKSVVLPEHCFSAQDDRTFVLTDKCSPRARMLKIAEQLTLNDVSKLVFLFADKLSVEYRDERRPLSVLHQLETVGVMNLDQPDTVAFPLYTIGRKDLAAKVASAGILCSLPHSLRSAHQLACLKASMLQRHRSAYSLQCKLMSTLLAVSRSTFEGQVVRPLVRGLMKSYQFSTVIHLSVDALSSVEKNNFDRIFQLTLPNIFDFLGAHSVSLHHTLTCENISLSTVISCFQIWSKSYSRFEGIMNEIQWNTELMAGTRKEFIQRHTPIGTPARGAVQCLYDVCSELYGGNTIKSVLKMIDKKLYLLEHLYYAYSCREAMIKWLQALLCLLTTNRITCDLQLLKVTLLKVAKEERFRSIYPYLSSVVSQDVMKKMSERLSKEGIDVENEFIQDNFIFSEDNYALCTDIPAYAYLFYFLQCSYFGPDSVNLNDVLSKLKDFHLKFITSSSYVSSMMKVYKNAIRAFQLQVDKFQRIAVQSNELCADTIKFITS